MIPLHESNHLKAESDYTDNYTLIKPITCPKQIGSKEHYKKVCPCHLIWTSQIKTMYSSSIILC